MHKPASVILTIVVLIVSYACTTVAPPPLMASIGSPNDSYILIGATEQDYEYQFTLVAGSMANGKFKAPYHFGDPPAYGPAEDGFILIKTTPATTYSVRTIEVLVKGTHLTAFSYEPCNGALLFTPEAGKVKYIGTVTLTDRIAEGFVMPVMSMFVRSDPGAAKSFLDKHYPALAKTLVTTKAGPYSATGAKCKPDYPFLVR